ncbi:hypothetical protein O6H91_08G062200 [Diphasiastrum complanatum]|uniref:Uncharacterized protein n=1 Tax=Diphasiastrum complanatum TaxID=34168 RepID=A0ACC2CYB3_DIPCM|nr:hypothetical protein O6H91_08G062200 [Diphasiastrum complanatum]
MMAQQQHAHPYVPRTLELPGFVPPSFSSPFLFGVYGAASLLLVVLTWSISKRHAHLNKVERLLLCWWWFTGLTHVILEGYFVFTPDFYKKQSNFLADVWKEYSKGDSRYAARDMAVISVEGITAVLAGPASLLAVYSIIARRPYQHPLQLIISVGQLYGDAVYFITYFFGGTEHRLPGLTYFWLYIVFMNGIWVVIPSIIAIRSWNKIIHAFTKQKET